MRINDLMDTNRREELHAILRWIDGANFEELAKIVEEIRCCHDCLFAFCEDRKFVAKIESICLNGESIQLNIEKDKSD